MKLFSNRTEAGRRLTAALKSLVRKDAIILAIPRGGVEVGYEIAQALGTQLDIIIPRKIGAPSNPELAIGAMTEDGTIILDDDLIKNLQVSKDYIKEESEKQRLEIDRRLRLYRGDIPYPSLKNRQVIIVDDGIATGSTAKAALKSVRNRGAKNVIIAIPVGPKTTVDELKKLADNVVCLLTPEPFYAIGQFYEDFTQTSDEEVIRLLESNKQQMKRRK